MKLVDGNLCLRMIEPRDLEEYWEVSYGGDKEWMKWNGPYFNDPVYTKNQFLNKESGSVLLQDDVMLIEVDQRIVGVISYDFQDGKLKKWLEFGIIIFDVNVWGQHIGKRSTLLWLEYLFHTFKDVERIGFTTWSGNTRMMALGESVGMTLEGRLRKVRYYDGKYWDSIKYGILREEFYNKKD